MTKAEKYKAMRRNQDIRDTQASLFYNLRSGNEVGAKADREALARMGVTVC